MRIFFYIFVLMLSMQAIGQNRDEITVMSNARLLHKTVFDTKDSATLVRLFSDKLSYGHSSGKIENKQEALKGIIHNKSVYEELNLGATSVWIDGNTAVTRYNMSANEKKADGKTSALKLHIVLVWLKEKKDWKLIARQAVKISQ